MNRKQFVASLRTALMQLDDLQSLARNPLLALLSSPGEEANPVALQRLLLETIEAMREKPGARAERHYDVLYYRYQEQLNQEEVAFQLGVSTRQLRREQNNAIELLADQLWAHFEPAIGRTLHESQPRPHAANGIGEIQKEAARLRHELRTEPSQVEVELQKALTDASALAHRYQVTLQVGALSVSAQTPAPPPVLRQAFLVLLTAMIPRIGGKTLVVSPAESAGKHRFVFCVRGATAEWARHEEFLVGVRTAVQLLAPFHGDVVVQEGESVAIALTTPKMASTPILVIDDNPDARQLFRRYVDQTRFRVITTGDGREAIALAQAQRVEGLILDIMMPDLDGWDLLSQWRHHPATRHIPVAVCTILPQKELAQVLGATLFIQKPVGQEDFLHALEQLTATLVKAPC
ncbi:MAG: response regulator [Caldilineaceae bacterium]|nr:response regulator [Caldilineaceae bacterium]